MLTNQPCLNLAFSLSWIGKKKKTMLIAFSATVVLSRSSFILLTELSFCKWIMPLSFQRCQCSLPTGGKNSNSHLKNASFSLTSHLHFVHFLKLLVLQCLYYFTSATWCSLKSISNVLFAMNSCIIPSVTMSTLVRDSNDTVNQMCSQCFLGYALFDNYVGED